MSNNGNGTMGHGYYFEDLAVGMEASYSKKITNEDVLAFAELSGDTNPVHLNDAFAAGTIFKKRIAWFSLLFPCSAPSRPGCIYLSQNSNSARLYRRRVVATCKVTSSIRQRPRRARLRLSGQRRWCASRR
jgi:3-hydroxybutyryl-CoA dehydratase